MRRNFPWRLYRREIEFFFKWALLIIPAVAFFSWEAVEYVRMLLR